IPELPNMYRRTTHLLLSGLLIGVTCACDAELVDRGTRYLERTKLALLDSFSSKVSDNRETLMVNGFLPQPNYSGNADAGDAAQLVDGKLVTPPMWTKKESVGWFGQTPVLIELQRKKRKSASGKIRVHSGLGLYADTALPRQIDVYTETRDGLIVAGSYLQRGALKVEDKRNYWLEVPVSNLGQRVIVALHTNSAFLQIDEVEFVPDPAAANSMPAEEPLAISSLEDIRDDSAKRLRVNLELNASDRSASKRVWREKFAADSLTTWIADPWDPAIGELSPGGINPQNKTIEVEGLDKEFETLAIGLYSTGVGVQQVDVEVKGLDKEQYSLMQLEHVLAADGEMAFDPLPALRGNSLKILPGWPTLLWIKLDLKKFPQGKSTGEIIIRDRSKQNENHAFPLQINVFDAKKLKSPELQAAVWGYSNDMPIWSDPQKALSDQQNHYVNVWIVNPVNIPGLKLDGNFREDLLARLQNDLALYKDQGRVRLYLGWTLENNPLGLNKNQLALSGERRTALKNWLEKINQIMQAAGYADTDWELYPVDEPGGEALTALAEIATVIRETLPGVGIYANPIDTHSYPTKPEQLQALTGLIDSWQPILALVRDEKFNGFFRTLDAAWGFYHNPPVPAKRADALEHYRAQGWWAWALGATEVGFWAYSDSTGSSVWDDFDGRRPDFAVVYEQSDHLVSSRRWEAFAEGIEDYQLLVGSGLAVPADFAVEQLDSRTIRELRHKALQALSQ
ncbi:MAG: hypothetical protein KDJ38_19310, partial [Gammaproteobacteria bacterium]|nr:hypothetical protein [Gammaproteobacteria bacterium]